MIVVHGVGPVYWGVEYDTDNYKRLSHAWLIQDLPPYRRSTRGVRVRVGRHALHLGLCKRGEDPHRRMPEVSVAEIGRWGKRAEAKIEAPTDPTTVSPGPVERHRDLRSDGDLPG